MDLPIMSILFNLTLDSVGYYSIFSLPHDVPITSACHIPLREYPILSLDSPMYLGK